MHFAQKPAGLLGSLLLFALLSTFGASTSFSRGQSVSMEPNSPVAISLDYPFNEGPVAGHVPFVVSIRNNMGEDGLWTVVARTESGPYNIQKSHESVFRLAVGDGQTKQFHLSALVADFGEGQYNRYDRQMYLDFRGPHTVPYSTEYRTLANYNSSSSKLNSVLMSPKFYREERGNLSAIYDRRGNPPLISTYEASILPEDWRCYVGYDLIFMDQDDWLSLDRSKRSVILDAVASGQVDLRFVMKTDALTPELARDMAIPADRRVWAHGLGVVSRHEKMSPESIQSANRAGVPRGMLFDLNRLALPETERMKNIRAQRSGTEDRRTFDQAVHKEPNSGGLISILIVLFGILVGPVNLFVLAKGRKRLRIFITTPLIAGGATMVLVLSILLADGIGGEGAISRLVFIQPGADQVYVRQEQVSQTGLFFGDSFEVDGEELMHFQGAALSSYDMGQEMGEFRYADGRHSGDWFTSKRLQRHYLSTYLRERESIDVLFQEGKSPELFSNFRGICEVIYFLDDAGAVWRARDLRLGGQEVLERVPLNELEKWYANQCHLAGGVLGKELGEFGLRKGHYYAAVRDWQQSGLETVEGIDWEVHTQVLIGQPEPAGKGGSVE